MKERIQHLEWISSKADLLEGFGPISDLDNLAKEKAKAQTSAQTYNKTYTTQDCDSLYSLREAVLNDLSKKNTVIECCPSSNRFIGQMSDLNHHPIKRFLQAGLNVIVSSDDPGIFATNLKKEYKLCLDSIGLTKDQMKIMAENAKILERD